MAYAQNQGRFDGGGAATQYDAAKLGGGARFEDRRVASPDHRGPWRIEHQDAVDEAYEVRPRLS